MLELPVNLASHDFRARTFCWYSAIECTPKFESNTWKDEKSELVFAPSKQHWI
jgi:hypothetical protein